MVIGDKSMHSARSCRTIELHNDCTGLGRAVGDWAYISPVTLKSGLLQERIWQVSVQDSVCTSIDQTPVTKHLWS